MNAFTKKGVILKAMKMLLVLLALSMVTGCAYGGVASAGKGRVVVTRNDGFLFGLLRKVFVCKATPNGLSDCREGEAP